MLSSRLVYLIRRAPPWRPHAHGSGARSRQPEMPERTPATATPRPALSIGSRRRVPIAGAGAAKSKPLAERPPSRARGNEAKTWNADHSRSAVAELFGNSRSQQLAGGKLSDGLALCWILESAARDRSLNLHLKGSAFHVLASFPRAREGGRSASGFDRLAAGIYTNSIVPPFAPHLWAKQPRRGLRSAEARAPESLGSWGSVPRPPMHKPQSIVPRRL